MHCENRNQRSQQPTEDARVRQAYMKATQDAVALHAQATQGAINTRATAEVVSASATRVAMENDALRESLALTATLQAAQFTIITTKTALEGEAKVRAATVEADTAGLRQWLLIGAFVTAMLVVAFTTTRTVKRTTERVGDALPVKPRTAPRWCATGRTTSTPACSIAGLTAS